MHADGMRSHEVKCDPELRKQKEEEKEKKKEEKQKKKGGEGAVEKRPAQRSGRETVSGMERRNFHLYASYVCPAKKPPAIVDLQTAGLFGAGIGRKVGTIGNCLKPHIRGLTLLVKKGV